AELIARDATGVVFAGIAYKAATEACYAAGIGAELELSVGASLDTKGSKPVHGRFTVKFLHETSDPTDRQSVVSVSGIDLVLSAKRRPYHKNAIGSG
ncbi:MlrC C-terminal domain-containing protein, partial [Rhizobium ruizarguesonis]